MAWFNFKKGTTNDAANNISTPENFTFMVSRTLIIRASVVYRVDLIQPRCSSLVVIHRTADIRVILDILVTLGLVLVELSTSISGSHAAMYVVNVQVS